MMNQDALGGSSRTLMIVTVSPLEDSSDESLCTLHFATRVRNIVLAPTASLLKTKNLEQELKTARAEVRNLTRKWTSAEEV